MEPGAEVVIVDVDAEPYPPPPAVEPYPPPREEEAREEEALPPLPFPMRETLSPPLPPELAVAACHAAAKPSSLNFMNVALPGPVINMKAAAHATADTIPPMYAPARPDESGA